MDIKFLILLAQIFTLVHGFKIDCKHQLIHYNNLRRVPFCIVQNDLKITTKDVRTASEVTGLSNKTMTQEIFGLDIKNKTTIYFPKGLNEHFPNLEIIDINHGRLVEIHQSDLKPFKKLKVLAISQNDIEYLEENLFLFNPQLEAVWMFKNKIQNIHPKVFTNLVKLHTIQLQNNSCIDEKVFQNQSEVPKFIKQINFQCTSLDDYKFQTSPCDISKKFQQLDCSFIKLDCEEMIEIYTCSSKTNFKDENTRIYRTTGENLENLTNFEVKAFSSVGKDFFFFPENLYEFLPNLISITVVNGKLKEIHQADLKHFKNLQYLNLNHNNLTKIEYGLFDFNQNLKIIRLNSNILQLIDFETLSNLKKLEVKDFSPNCSSSRISDKNESYIQNDCEYTEPDKLSVINERNSKLLYDVECRKKNEILLSDQKYQIETRNEILGEENKRLRDETDRLMKIIKNYEKVMKEANETSRKKCECETKPKSSGSNFAILIVCIGILVGFAAFISYWVNKKDLKNEHESSIRDLNKQEVAVNDYEIPLEVPENEINHYESLNARNIDALRLKLDIKYARADYNPESHMYDYPNVEFINQ